VTQAEVVAAIDADPRLPTQRDRCEVYRRLARWGRSFDEAGLCTRQVGGLHAFRCARTRGRGAGARPG
jgi:hypothetical protein